MIWTYLIEYGGFADNGQPEHATKLSGNRRKFTGKKLTISSLEVILSLTYSVIDNMLRIVVEMLRIFKLVKPSWLIYAAPATVRKELVSHVTTKMRSQD